MRCSVGVASELLGGVFLSLNFMPRRVIGNVQIENGVRDRIESYNFDLHEYVRFHLPHYRRPTGRVVWNLRKVIRLSCDHISMTSGISWGCVIYDMHSIENKALFQPCRKYAYKC
jgi:hypothetical protein